MPCRLLTTDAGAADTSLMFPQGAADPALCHFLRDLFSLQFAGIPGFQGVPGAGYAAGDGNVIPSERATGAPHAAAAAPCCTCIAGIDVADPVLCPCRCHRAGPLAAVVTPEVKVKQAVAISQYFHGQGTLARLGATKNPLLWMG